MKKVLDYLSSRRVSVYLFLILLFVSILGALIPQKELPAYYEAHYRPWAVTVLKTFQLTDLYHAWYFFFLLAFLVASLTTCTIRRLPRVLRPFRRRLDLPPRLQDLSPKAALGPEAAAPALEEAARGLGFRWRRVDGVLYGRRRPYAVWGEILTHVGLILIFAGGVLRLFGHREAVYVFEGHGVALPAVYGEGYELWADKVEEIRDPDTGRVLEFRTAARLLHHGEEVASRDIEVNGPLRHGGFGLYQSNMDAAGATGLALEAVKLGEGETAVDVGATTFSWEIGEANGTVVASPGQTRPLGETGYQLRFLDYYEHFVTDETGFRDDNPEYNPAAFINVVNPSGAAATGIIFGLYPEYSILRPTEENFSTEPVTIALAGAGEGTAADGRREYLLRAGTAVVMGDPGERVEIDFAPGEGPENPHARDLPLTARLGGETVTLPRGEWVNLKLADGDYALRYKGVRRGALTGLTITRDPGVAVFYLGCLLLSIGVAAAMLLSYDELFLYRRDGKVYLAGRSNKGRRLLQQAFETWVEKIKRGL